MFYKQLGNTGIELPALTLGAWAIEPGEGSGLDKETAIAALRKGYELGCNAIDTGAAYGLGCSEEVTGELMEDLPRDKIILMTKCGVIGGGHRGRYMGRYDRNGKDVDVYRYAGRDSIIKECEDSLRRLRTDYIDVYSLHFPDETTPIAESMEAFERLRSQGKIRAAGVCNFSADQLKEAGDATRLASIKRSYSMLNRQIEKDVVPYCLENGMGVLTYSILQRGILTGKNVDKFLRTVDEDPAEALLYENGNMERIGVFLDRINELAMDKGVEVYHICLRWVVEQPGIAAGLIGATSASQVENDFRALTFPFTREDADFIERHLTALMDQLDFAPVTAE